jgi:hypothetical protein
MVGLLAWRLEGVPYALARVLRMFAEMPAPTTAWPSSRSTVLWPLTNEAQAASSAGLPDIHVGRMLVIFNALRRRRELVCRQ